MALSRNLVPSAALCALALVFLPAQAEAKAAPATALDEYVKKADPHYHWELKSNLTSAAGTYYVLELTSQQWRSEAEVTHSVWKHWLSIYQPAKVTSPVALMIVAGGSVDAKEPRPESRAARIAVTTGSVVAEVRGIPNEPVRFAGETRLRTEDGIIAYTWDKFIKTGDDTWPLRLPMTKAVVRAMDAVTEFMRKQASVDVDHYVVLGASKRGWTTWTTAAVDPRVVAAVPVVIDTLNVGKSLEHHFRAYGFWAPSIRDYFDMGLMDKLRDPNFEKLMAIEDPYSYRARLTMPKYIINSAGDQFFLPDLSQYYFSELQGEKYLRYIPNTDHSLKGSDVWQTATAFYNAVIHHQPIPKFDWKFEKDGSIRVTTRSVPSAVKLWQATNPKHRDFRLESVGPIYESTDLAPVKKGVYAAKVQKPPAGFTAYFVELTFPSSINEPFKFTTPVRIIPDVLPFPPPEPGKTHIGPRKQTD
ncbi:MAG: PhoPQ-activated pathogenicity-related family protein [Bryobacterales bacterium]|nr:PhoPQ-activated pathogenicity-related family protein [Bryobacterales bacterium]